MAWSEFFIKFDDGLSIDIRGNMDHLLDRVGDLKVDKKIAILIDAENVSEKYLKNIVDEVAKYGTPTVKRLYTDWTLPQSSKWKHVLLDNGLVPVQQYRYTKGKNSSDSAMIIDAMDILYSGNVQGFCIVSSDSDFTRLAQRIRESGLFVLGMGERKTPDPFKKACDIFTYLENIDESMVEVESSVVFDRNELFKRIEKMILELSNDDGLVNLSDLGNWLIKRESSFDTRNYGFPKLVQLVESFDKFEVISEKRPNGPSIKYVKMR